MFKFKKQSGYSLVEVLVSISILLIAIVGPMTIAVQGLKTAAFSLQQNTAFFLAQEGVESLFAMRDGYMLQEADGTSTDGWEDFRNDITSECTTLGASFSTTGDTCSLGVEMVNGAATFVGVDCTVSGNCRLYTNASGKPAVYTHNIAGTASPYERIVTLEYASTNSIFVKSEVVWTSNLFAGVTQRVVLDTALFDLII